MLEELLNVLNKYFKAKKEFDSYDGSDRYSSITTNMTEKYKRISKEFFDAEFELETTLQQMEGHWQDYIGKKFYWGLKTWADIHSLAKENPSRMIHCEDMPGSVCANIMGLKYTAEKYLLNLVEIENEKTNKKTESGT